MYICITKQNNMNHLIDSDNGAHSFSPFFNGEIETEELTEFQLELLEDERKDIRNGQFDDLDYNEVCDRLNEINNILN